jgi:hypothetical protein
LFGGVAGTASKEQDQNNHPSHIHAFYPYRYFARYYGDATPPGE